MYEKMCGFGPILGDFQLKTSGHPGDDLVCESPPLGVRFSSSKVAVLAVFGVSAKV